MIYKRLAIENVRSYVTGKIDFFDGFQCLVGGVGAGKTTILLAIDFALFGKPLFGLVRGFDYLLRSGSDRGKVEFEFVHNNKTYRIIREIGRKGTRIFEDTDKLALYEDGELVARGKEEAVEEEIVNAIGLDYKLFREILWVQQERLKEIIDLPPGKRRERVDGILGLSDLEVAWEKMRDYERHFENRIKRIMDEDPYIPLIARERERYEDLAQRLIETRNTIHDLTHKKVELEAELKERDQVLQDLERLDKELKEWERKKYRIEIDVSSSEKALREILTAIEQMRESLEKQYREKEDVNREMVKIQRELDKLGVKSDLDGDGVRIFLRDLDESRRRIESEIAAARALLRDLEIKTESLLKHERCPTCLQPIDVGYRERIRRELTKQASIINKRVTTSQGSLKKLTELTEKVRSLQDSLERGRSRFMLMENTLTSIQEELDGKEAMYSEGEARVEKLRKELQDLLNSKPDFDRKLADRLRLDREDLSKRHARLESKLEQLNELKGQLGSQLNEIRRRLSRAERDSLLVERARKSLRYVKELRELYRRAQPVIRKEYVQWLESTIQNVLSDIRGGEPLEVRVDEESYTPIISIGRGEPISLPSGGERTQLALAFRVGLSQLVMDTRGRGLEVLLLDEPTASLGREDMSISQLAEAVSRLRGVRQIIAVTHSEDFAEKSRHVIEITKTGTGSEARAVQ